MHGVSQLGAQKVVASFDLSSYKHMVDVGGGTGVLVFEALRAYPELRASVFELPSVVKHTKQFLVRMQMLQQERDQRKSKQLIDVESRVALVAGDFFADELPEGDLFVLSQILHDWGDSKCVQLLEKIYRRLPENGAVLIAEKLLDESRCEALSVIIQDLNMLVQTEGKERTLKDFVKMLSAVGFAEVQGTRTGSYLDAVLARKKCG